MSNRIFIKPANSDVQVRNPDRNGEHLPVDGAEVERSTYWIRRLKDGDVIESKLAKKSANKEQ